MDTCPDAAAIRAHYGEPSRVAVRKQLARLDRHARAFIALSPFLVIASADADGRADATPRGDAPGFVAVADDTTLLIPDRPGNRRVDTFLNVAANPQVGLLFFVPGINETLRVNGHTRFTSDAARLAPFAAGGKPPLGALVVAVEEVFFHCGKALIRADLWNPARHLERRSFPTLGRILGDQIAEVDGAEYERTIEDAYRTRLY